MQRRQGLGNPHHTGDTCDVIVAVCVRTLRNTGYWYFKVALKTPFHRLIGALESLSGLSKDVQFDPLCSNGAEQCVELAFDSVDRRHSTTPRCVYRPHCQTHSGASRCQPEKSCNSIAFDAAELPGQLSALIELEYFISSNYLYFWSFLERQELKWPEIPSTTAGRESSFRLGHLHAGLGSTFRV